MNVGTTTGTVAAGDDSRFGGQNAKWTSLNAASDFQTTPFNQTFSVAGGALANFVTSGGTTTFPAGSPIQFTTAGGGSLPGGLQTNVTYYVIGGSSSYVQISTDKNASTPFSCSYGSSGTVTVVSANTIVMITDQRTNIRVGRAVKYTTNGTLCYGRVSAITATSITIQGIALNSGSGLLTTLAYSPLPGQVEMLYFAVTGYFDYTTVLPSYLLKNAGGQVLPWGKEIAHLVNFEITQLQADTGLNQSKLNVILGSNSTIITDTGGMKLGSGGSLIYSDVDIDQTKYTINPEDIWDIQVTTNGSNRNGQNLSGRLIFVYE